MLQWQHICDATMIAQHATQILVLTQCAQTMKPRLQLNDVETHLQQGDGLLKCKITASKLDMQDA